MELKESVLSKFNESVSRGMAYLGILCVSDFDDLRRKILQEAHGS